MTDPQHEAREAGDALKPCPRCGQEAERVDFPDSAYVRCMAAHCGMEIPCMPGDGAVTTWNERPVEDALRARAAEAERRVVEVEGERDEAMALLESVVGGWIDEPSPLPLATLRQATADYRELHAGTIGVRVEDLVAMASPWISAKDRMPDDQTIVLFLAGGARRLMGRRHCRRGETDPAWYTGDHNAYEDHEVTHWMSFPALPK